MSDKKDSSSLTQSNYLQELQTQVEEFLKAWFQVRQQIQQLNFNRTHQNKLNTTQFIVLNFLEEASPDNPYTISGLATTIKLDPATIVRTVDSLENQGLVIRRRDKQDRRKVFVEFSEEGRAIQQQSRQNFKNSIINIFEKMSDAGRTALVKGLQEFVTVGSQEIPTLEDKA